MRHDLLSTSTWFAVDVAAIALVGTSRRTAI
jgi:hypothetical protein